MFKKEGLVWVDIFLSFNEFTTGSCICFMLGYLNAEIVLKEVCLTRLLEFNDPRFNLIDAISIAIMCSKI